METTSKFYQYLKAGYPALWVETHEEFRAIVTLAFEASGYSVFSWDIITGTKDHATGKYTVDRNDKGVPQPETPLKALRRFQEAKEDSVLFLKDYHKYLNNSIEVLRMTKNLIGEIKAKSKHIIIVSPVVQIPVELEKDFTLLPFILPTVDDLVKVAEKIIKDNGIYTDKEKKVYMKVDEQTVSVGRGLTLNEAENAMARSLVEKKVLSKDIIQEEKLQVIKKSGMMELFEPIPESELVMDGLKSYIHKRKKAFDSGSKLPKPKGIILTGVPGGGKSLAAKVVASIFGCPLVRLDIGALKGSKVGESEAKMRAALAQIDALGFVVVWMDEIEKILSGVQSSGHSDAGTTSTMFGTLLTWMQESKSPHYIIATCNEVADLLSISQGALIRRFDDLFYVDVPTEKERKEIISLMNKRYSTKLNGELLSMSKGWTGAEIEKFVVASLFDGYDEALANVHPIAEQNKGLLDISREWALRNARRANSIEGEKLNPSAMTNEEVERLYRESIAEKEGKRVIKMD